MLQIETTQTNAAVLSADVVAAYRLPIPITAFTALCQHSPKGAQLEQRGEWAVIIDPSRKGDAKGGGK